MNKGFTLVELMIVVMIIGILAAIAIPTYQDYISRSQLSEAILLAEHYKNLTSLTYTQTNLCPTTTELSLSNNNVGKYVKNLHATQNNIGNCVLTIEFRSMHISPALASKHLNFSLGNSNSTNWICTSQDIQQKYLPSNCAGI